MNERATVAQRKEVTPIFSPVGGGMLQRRCACGQHTVAGGECAECREKRTGLQRRSANQSASTTVPPTVHEVLRSPGQSLDSATRALMEPRFGHDFSQVRVHTVAPKQIQTKLTIDRPGDKYEREANRVAEQVMRMPEPQASPGAGVFRQVQNTHISRQCSTCGGEARPRLREEEEILQAEGRSGHIPEVTPALESRLSALKSVGQSLPEPARSFLEPRFGFDFGQVRLHTDANAAGIAHALNARAFTLGRDVFFGRGECQPASSQGRRLIAHELTHVIQQGAATPLVRRSTHSYSPIPRPSRLTPQTARLQRTTADRSKAPSGMACTVDASPGHTAGTDIMFGRADKTLDPIDMVAIVGFHALWLAGGGIDSIIIDGFASIDGRQRFNWQLSCDRAEAVKTALKDLGVPGGMITTVAHGESEEFSTSSRPPNRRAIIHTLPGTVPTVIVFPVIFGSTINRVPPGVGTRVAVLVAGLPAGRTITLDIQGSGGANGTATVAPASIAGSSVVTVTGGIQTTPGHANNLMVRARIGGRTLATSLGFTVAAHPRDFTVSFNGDVSTATHVGVRSNNAWTSDGSGGVADLTEVDRSEQVDVLSRDDPPFGPGAGIGRTSGFIAGTASPTVDTHTIPRSAISTPFWLPLFGTHFSVVKEQLFIFNDRRTGVTNQVVPNSGFTITHSLTRNAARPGWDHQCVKTGAATTVGAFSATAGSGTATSLVHPM